MSEKLTPEQIEALVAQRKAEAASRVKEADSYLAVIAAMTSDQKRAVLQQRHADWDRNQLRYERAQLETQISAATKRLIEIDAIEVKLLGQRTA